MKYSVRITLILLFVFFLAQIFGLFTVNRYIEVFPAGSVFDGEIMLSPIIFHEDTILGPAPEYNGPEGLITITLAVLFGTSLLLILARFKRVFLWKVWFFLSVFITSGLTLDIYMPVVLAFVLSFILAVLKIIKPNIITHNFTEILMYTGIAVIFVSFFNLFWAFILLILISVYDMIAVWKSKHMITLAKFTIESKIFPGLNFPYCRNDKIISKPQHGVETKSVKSAILGGGDIAFPLIFSSVVMEHLITVKQILKPQALLLTFIISITTTLTLGFLFYISKKGKFYPAMPFVSAGSFFGYLIILLMI